MPMAPLLATTLQDSAPAIIACPSEAIPMNMPQIETPSMASQLKLDAHWMPFSANRNFQRDPRLIVGAEGSWLIDDQGRKVYDSLSGLWTCGAGHSRKEI